MSEQRLIDADDLLVYLHCRMGQIPCDEYGLDLLADVAEYVAKTPTIEAEPVKHGKWEFYDFTSPIMFCSECKALAGWDSCGDYQSVMSAYCPNCGARMDKECE